MTVKQIKNKLIKNGITQGEFAKYIHISRSQVNRWLNGSKAPTKNHLLSMELMLDIMLKEK